MHIMCVSVINIEIDEVVNCYINIVINPKQGCYCL